MASRTGIAWCDSTFNPWIGCSKVSPACDHCYAERDFDLRRHVVKWGAGQPRHRTSVANWKQVECWNAKPFYECEACGWRGEDSAESSRLHICPHCGTRLVSARRRVFCASLADVFDNEVPIAWLAELLDLFRLTPYIDKLALTKRIGNVRRRLREAMNYANEVMHNHMLAEWICAWLDSDSIPPDVWIGATVCNQEEADRDIPKLLEVPVAVRFLSIEPMLGPIDLTRVSPRLFDAKANVLTGKWKWNGGPTVQEQPPIDWVICGGESGKNARPMHPDWAHSLRDQCSAAGVPFFFKQWGEFAPVGNRDDGVLTDFVGMSRVGLKVAGRLLDGNEHNEFPEAA